MKKQQLRKEKLYASRKYVRAARIHANDGDGHRLKIAIEFTSQNGLLLCEVQQVRRKLARQVALLLNDLPYTDFGPENIDVNLLRRL
jgi:hypothetical protein